MSDWTTKPALWSDKHEIVEKDAQGFDIIIGRICAQEDARRIVAEHNALAGIPDPAKAIEAARDALVAANGVIWSDVVGEKIKAQIRAALALLDGKNMPDTSSGEPKEKRTR